ncbi:hypothetical protein PRJ_5505 (plasmid) [Pseudomonas sp. XWY-1]|nr:hypothetical protein PRJ_5505 [Pseudomonas sp. XWY-1]
MNTWVSFQSAEQPLLGQFSVSGNRFEPAGVFKLPGCQVQIHYLIGQLPGMDTHLIDGQLGLNEIGC